MTPRKLLGRLYQHLRLGEMTQGARRGLFYLAALMALIVGGAYYQSTVAINTLRSQVQNQCGFTRDLGDVAAAPVMVNPATHKASKVGIAIIADSRSAFRGLDCPGQLTKPGPTFVRWAKFYNLPTD